MAKVTALQKKRDPLIMAGSIAAVLCLIVRIPLLRSIGAEGVAFFAPVNELFLLCIVFFSSGLCEAMSQMIYYRVGRGQYRNAERVFAISRNVVLIFCLILSLIILIGSKYIAEVLFLQGLSRMALLMVIPAIILMGLSCLLRGYFQGVGSTYPAAHSLILEKSFGIVFVILGAAYFYEYGEKVAAILHSNSHAAAYGAFGAVLGLAAAALIAFLHLLIIYIMYRRTIQTNIYRDSSRGRETPGHLYRTLLMLALPYGTYMVLSQLGPLINQRIFYHFAGRMNEGGEIYINMAAEWGNYYGIYLVVMGVLVAAICPIFIEGGEDIAKTYIRGEQRPAQEQLHRTFLFMLLAIVPVTILTAVLAEPLAGLLGAEDMALSKGLMQSGSALVFLLLFSLFWMELLRHYKRIHAIGVLAAGGLCIQMGLLWLLLMSAKDGGQLIYMVVLANLAGAAFSFLAGFVFICRTMKMGRDWMHRCIRSLVISLLCGAIIGLMSVFLSGALLDLLGSVATIIICPIVMAPIYLILMSLLRGLSAAEADKLPGGQYLVRIGQKLRIW